MYYYKVLNAEGNAAYLLTYDQQPNITDPLYVEITAEEHAAIEAEFAEKEKLVGQVYRGEITIDDVLEAWREEIQLRVDEMIKQYGEYVPQPTESELAVDEALTILHGKKSE